MKNFKLNIKRIKSIFFYVLPLILLLIIYSKLNISEIIKTISKSDFFYLLIGFLLNPLLILFGALRWFNLIRRVEKVKFSFVLKHYWIGLGLGYFVPSSLGWDIYRITSISRESKNFLRHVSIITYEKLFSFLSYGLMVLALIPFLKINNSNYLDLKSLVLTFSLVIIFVISIFFLVQKSSFFKNLIKNLITKTLNTIKSRLLKKETNTSEFINNQNFHKIKLHDIFVILFFTLLIQLFSALITNLLFLSIGINLSIIINLFAVSALTIIFILPISFGSIGVREGAYILLFGLFNILPEKAVTVSIMTFLGLVLNNSIGLLILFFNNIRKKKFNPCA